MIWLDNNSGNMRVSYGIKGEWQVLDRPESDTVLESFEVRSPDSVMKNLGTMTFYGSSKICIKAAARRMTGL